MRHSLERQCVQPIRSHGTALLLRSSCELARCRPSSTSWTAEGQRVQLQWLPSKLSSWLPNTGCRL